MSRVLVVGGAGYIGSVLCRSLLTAGHSVVSYDKLLYGGASIAGIDSSRFVRINADTRNISMLRAAIHDCDAVVYLAELVGDPICAAFPEEAHDINELAPICAIKIAKQCGVKRFIYMSSCSVYGSSEDPDTILTETSELAPLSSYAKHKIEVEKVLFADGGFPGFCAFRLGTVFGYSHRPRFDLVVNIMTAKAFTDKRIEVFGGKQWRPHAHVRDVADAIMLTLGADEVAVSGQVFNVITDNARISEIADDVKVVMPDIEVTTKGADVDLRNYRVSGEKARNSLGYVPRFTVEAGIRELLVAFGDGRLEDYPAPHYSNQQWYRGDGYVR